MSEAALAVLTQAKALPIEDQRWLGEQLRDDSAEVLEEIDGYAEWREELDRRLQSVADGTAKLIPFEEAMNQIREEVARRIAK